MKAYGLIAAVTFFFILTAQLLWSTIHGDGAVYAWIVRGLVTAGLFSSQLPKWTPTQSFAEHPYLFFYFASLFSSVLGFSDWVMKLPNLTVAVISLWAVFEVGRRRNVEKKNARTIGLIAAYVLVLNAVYVMQVSQPSLDPLAQGLAFASVFVLIFFDLEFISGLFLGLAFLTKGLELLPNLAALFALIGYLKCRSAKGPLRSWSRVGFGVLVPVVLWLAVDRFVWNSQWSETYWSRQFTHRFLEKNNMQRAFSLSYLSTFLQTYSLELIVLIVGVLKSKIWNRRSDALFLYFLFYVFFNVLAFLVIKKDSSQHLTGIILFGAVFVGEYLSEAAEHVRFKIAPYLSATLLLLGLIYWSWYIIYRDNNPDIWTEIKREAEIVRSGNLKTPVVVKDSTPDAYGVFHTAQWYFYPNKVYYQSEADSLLLGQDVVLLQDLPGLKLSKSKALYQKDVF